MSNRGEIPKRWLNCPRKSEIIAERFLAFKTPLCSAFTSQLPIECLFMPNMIFDYCKSVKLNLGLWIDLTNTNRFYDADEVKNRNAQYIKLQCRGHGETPSPEQTRSFIEFIEDFISDHPFDTVGVHCTHGFNRTGFLIVSYLVEKLDFAVDSALAMFANARPPGIYKQDYIDELFKRYDNISEVIQAPELPDWSFEYEDYSNGHVIGGYKRSHDSEFATTSQQAQDREQQFQAGDENQMQPGKKRRREVGVKDARFMEGVPGVQHVTDQPRLGELQLKVQAMCGWKSTGFPGSQPVSMDRKNINLLKEIPYMVSWKADGSRYMMLINARDEIYFFDRNYSCFEVENLSFVMSNNLHEHLTNTLLDGEMVLDKYQGNVTPRYLIYDIICINNKPIGLEQFPKRLRCIRKELMEPRGEAIKANLINRPIEPFSVRAKDFYDPSHTTTLLSDKFAKQLAHQPDGLIFQPRDEPYIAGVCERVLKWKPPELNSVDFRLKIVTESGIGILTRKVGQLFVLGSDVEFGKMRITKECKDLNNKIVECTLNDRLEWDFLRERTDKKLPNSFRTATAVVESIRNPVTKEGLINFIYSHGFKDDRERMPPPATYLVQRVSQQQQQQNQHQQYLLQQQQHEQMLKQQAQQQKLLRQQQLRKNEQEFIEKLQRERELELQQTGNDSNDEASEQALYEQNHRINNKSDSQSESSDYEEEEDQPQQPHHQLQQHYQRSALSDSDSN